MSWMHWIVVVWLALSAILVVNSIGKPRPPVTNGVATTSVIFTAVLIILIILG